MRKRTAKPALLSFILALALMLPFVSCGSRAEGAGRTGVDAASQADGVSSVLLNSRGSKLTVRCALSDTFISNNTRDTIYLYELPMGKEPNSESLAALTPAASFRTAAKYSWSDSLGGNSSRLYSTFVLAKKNSDGILSAVGAPVPVLNPELYAVNTSAFPAAVSIKGLQTPAASVRDALSLGISHAVIDVNIEDFLVIPDPAAPSTLLTESCVFDGVTYHFSPEALRELDSGIKSLSDESVIIYLRILLVTPPSRLPDKLRCLGFADAPAADSYAININNPECAGYVASLLEFLARRYTSPGREKGFCGAFIIGSDVNRASVSNAAAANADSVSYASLYERLVRIAHTALVSNYAAGRVYISLGSNWNEDPTESDTYGADSSASAFLANFSARSTVCGDYNWGIAASAYALDPMDSSIWDDPLATGASSQFISPANISVLTYALSKSYTFAGGMRNLIISSFGIHGDTDNGTGSSQNAQAASYAYAYYKVAADKDVDALIYRAIEDGTAEHTGADGTTGGSGKKQPLFGLRPAGMTTGKTIWNVFRSIDTNADSAVGTAGSVAGSEFSYLYNSLSSAVRVRKLITGDGRPVVESDKYHTNILFNFNFGTLHDFRTVSSSSGLDLTSSNGFPALHLYGAGESGIARTNMSSTQLRGSAYLIVNITGSSSAGRLTLRISQNGKNGSVLYEASTGYPAGEQTISFDISDFSKIASSDNINLLFWFVPDKPDTHTELTISSISTADMSKPAPQILWIIFISLALIFALLMLIAVFTRVLHRIKRRRARRGRTRQSGGGQGGGIVPRGEG